MDENVQIAIYEHAVFCRSYPRQYFTAQGNLLDHDQRKVNVFAAKKTLFANAYPLTLKVSTVEEVTTMKQRLLSLPIFLPTTLQRKQKLGNVSRITTGHYVVMVNTKHPAIQEQLRELLERAESSYDENGRFAMDIDLTDVLSAWFRHHLGQTYGMYYALQCRLCLTNFSRRSRLCENVALWILCLPFCLVIAPTYCVYRKLMSDDFTAKIKASVCLVRPTAISANAMRVLLQSAFQQGLNANQRMPQVQGTGQLYPPPPPAYSSLPSYDQVTSDPPTDVQQSLPLTP